MAVLSLCGPETDLWPGCTAHLIWCASELFWLFEISFQKSNSLCSWNVHIICTWTLHLLFSSLCFNVNFGNDMLKVIFSWHPSSLWRLVTAPPLSFDFFLVFVVDLSMYCTDPDLHCTYPLLNNVCGKKNGRSFFCVFNYGIFFFLPASPRHYQLMPMTINYDHTFGVCKQKWRACLFVYRAEKFRFDHSRCLWVHILMPGVNTHETPATWDWISKDSC